MHGLVIQFLSFESLIYTCIIIVNHIHHFLVGLNRVLCAGWCLINLYYFKEALLVILISKANLGLTGITKKNRQIHWELKHMKRNRDRAKKKEHMMETITCLKSTSRDKRMDFINQIICFHVYEIRWTKNDRATYKGALEQVTFNPLL